MFQRSHVTHFNDTLSVCLPAIMTQAKSPFTTDGQANELNQLVAYSNAYKSFVDELLAETEVCDLLLHDPETQEVLLSVDRFVKRAVLACGIA